MRLSRTPHLRVASAMWSCILELMVSRSDSDSSRVSSPNTARSAVRAIWSMARPKSLTSNSASLTSVTWQKMVALTHRDTLSLVITACWSPVRGNSRTSTLSIRSARGISTWRPGCWIFLNSPNRFTTPTQPCCTTFRHDFKKDHDEGEDGHGHHRQCHRRTYGTDDHGDHLLTPTVGTPRTQPPRRAVAGPIARTSGVVGRIDHEEATFHVGHHHGRAGLDGRAGEQGHRVPLLAPARTPSPARGCRKPPSSPPPSRRSCPRHRSTSPSPFPTSNP